MRLRNELVFSLILWLGVAALSLWAHFVLPDQPMATHFAADGTVNGYMPRDVGLAFGPGMVLVMIVLLLWLLPAIMPKAKSIDRSIAVYGLVTLAVIILIAFVHGLLVARAFGIAVDPARVVFAAIGALFILIGNFTPKMRQNWLMGIRTPWTLSDERVWDKTHRFAGPLFMLGGIAILVGAFAAPLAWRVAVVAIAAGVPAILAVIYSYLAARKLGSA